MAVNGIPSCTIGNSVPHQASTIPSLERGLVSLDAGFLREMSITSQKWSLLSGESAQSSKT